MWSHKKSVFLAVGTLLVSSVAGAAPGALPFSNRIPTVCASCNNASMRGAKVELGSGIEVSGLLNRLKGQTSLLGMPTLPAAQEGVTYYDGKGELPNALPPQPLADLSQISVNFVTPFYDNGTITDPYGLWNVVGPMFPWTHLQQTQQRMSPMRNFQRPSLSGLIRT